MAPDGHTPGNSECFYPLHSDERQSSHTAVQDVIGEVSSSEAWTARHADLLPKTRRSSQKQDSRPLFSFRSILATEGNRAPEAVRNNIHPLFSRRMAQS